MKRTSELSFEDLSEKDIEEIKEIWEGLVKFKALSLSGHSKTLLYEEEVFKIPYHDLAHLVNLKKHRTFSAYALVLWRLKNRR